MIASANAATECRSRRSTGSDTDSPVASSATSGATASPALDVAHAEDAVGTREREGARRLPTDARRRAGQHRPSSAEIGRVRDLLGGRVLPEGAQAT